MNSNLAHNDTCTKNSDTWVGLHLHYGFKIHFYINYEFTDIDKSSTLHVEASMNFSGSESQFCLLARDHIT
jgi:hypothetical protein